MDLIRKQLSLFPDRLTPFAVELAYLWATSHDPDVSGYESGEMNRLRAFLQDELVTGDDAPGTPILDGLLELATDAGKERCSNELTYMLAEDYGLDTAEHRRIVAPRNPMLS